MTAEGSPGGRPAGCQPSRLADADLPSAMPSFRVALGLPPRPLAKASGPKAGPARRPARIMRPARLGRLDANHIHIYMHECAYACVRAGPRRALARFRRLPPRRRPPTRLTVSFRRLSVATIRSSLLSPLRSLQIALSPPFLQVPLRRGSESPPRVEYAVPPPFCLFRSRRRSRHALNERPPRRRSLRARNERSLRSARPPLLLLAPFRSFALSIPYRLSGSRFANLRFAAHSPGPLRPLPALTLSR